MGEIRNRNLISSYNKLLRYLTVVAKEDLPPVKQKHVLALLW